MNKVLIVSIIILVIILGLIFVPMIYSSYRNQYIKDHNSKIDKSCTVDADCVVKTAVCSCNGANSGCINKDSVTAICAPLNAYCEMYSVPVIGCTCQEGTCMNIYENME